jgi:hypothetical protein
VEKAPGANGPRNYGGSKRTVDPLEYNASRIERAGAAQPIAQAEIDHEPKKSCALDSEPEEAEEEEEEEEEDEQQQQRRRRRRPPARRASDDEDEESIVERDKRQAKEAILLGMIPQHLHRDFTEDDLGMLEHILRIPSPRQENLAAAEAAASPTFDVTTEIHYVKNP